MIDPTHLPRVAMENMNDVHLEEVALINEIDAMLESDADVSAKLQELLAHTREHFEGEETMMEEQNFPPYPFHKGEHDAALEQMQKVFADFSATGDKTALTRYIRETLPAWIDNHIKTMDTVTAVFLTTGMSPCAMR